MPGVEMMPGVETMPGVVTMPGVETVWVDGVEEVRWRCR